MYQKRIKRAAESLGIQLPQNLRSKFAKVIVTVMTIAGAGLQVGTASANSLGSPSVALSDPRPSQAAVNYTFTGGSGAASSQVQSAAIKCIKVVVSTLSGGTVPPTGFDFTTTPTISASSTLINSSISGWTAATSGTPTKNILQYTNTTGVTPTTLTGATFIVSATNSSVPDVSYFYQIATFGNTDCATAPLDSALVKYINTAGSTLSLSVDPTLTFTVNAVASGAACDGTTTTAASTSTTIPFGSVSPASNAIVCQDLTASTNASNGYTVYTRYTAAPTNALNQTIADTAGTNAAPAVFSAAGTEAYGYTTNSAALGTGTANRFTNPAQNWAKETTTNAEVGYTAVGVNSTTYRIGHQVGVSLTTKPGVYTTTIIYTCTPIY